MRKDKAGSEVSLIFEFKIIDRISSTITPPYEAIGQAARSSEVNHINETSESKKNVLQWLWVMTNTMVAFFMSHPKDAAGWKESSHASGSFGKRGLAPTNNHAERILRFGVLWRKRSRGTASEKGNRWVERILSVRHTCRLQPWPLFPTLIDALQHYFNGTRPDLSWIHA